MPVTLAEARNNVQDDVQAGIIDEFRKSSFLLEAMTFDDVVSPGTGSSTLTYGYTRLLTQPTAQFRAINTEYTPGEVTRQRVTVDLKVFGGAYEIDRVIADNVSALISEVNLQASQKVKAARSLFHDTVINGDSAVDALSFDGLDKAITGSTTEASANEVTDVIGVSTREAALAIARKINLWLAKLDERPTALMGNGTLVTLMTTVAQYAGYYTESEDAFGNLVERYRGIPLVDLGDKPGSNNPVVPIENRTVNAVAQTGLTDLYAARLGLDAFHGLSPLGRELVRQWLPDYSTAGAVKKGEVELIAAVALKTTKSAGVLRNLKVQ
jgi:hypothetical protein